MAAPAASTPPSYRPRWRRWLARRAVEAGALFAAGNAVGFLVSDRIGGPGFKRTLLAVPALGWTHALGGAIAVLVGMLLVLHLRVGTPLHRALGRLYVLAVVGSSLASLAFLPRGGSGWWSSSAFLVLAVLWVATTLVALGHARGGRHAAHRRWMQRSVALALAATTLRIELGLFVLAGFDFRVAFALAAWSCWMVNLALVFQLQRRHVI